MEQVEVYNQSKEKVGTLEFPLGEADRKWIKTALIHQVAVAQLTNKRQGNAKVKNRHEVAGSTRKIVRQKGTGGARHGDIKAPIFVGGGQAFGPKPKEYDVRIPQKIRQAALKEVLLMRKSEGKLVIIDGISFEKPETKKAAALLKTFGIKGALFIIDEESKNVSQSVRNLEFSQVRRVESVSVVDILRNTNLVMTKAAYQKFLSHYSVK